jgi:hypothetical protein
MVSVRLPLALPDPGQVHNLQPVDSKRLKSTPKNHRWNRSQIFAERLSPAITICWFWIPSGYGVIVPRPSGGGNPRRTGIGAHDQTIRSSPADLRTLADWPFAREVAIVVIERPQ